MGAFIGETVGKENWSIGENGGKGALVGIVSDRSDWFIAEEIQPRNAPLISAAPDLLEACIMAINAIGALSVSSGAAENAFLKMQAAIEKATPGLKP